MTIDGTTQKQLIICLLAAVIILSGVVIWQSVGIQSLTGQINDVLNGVVPLDLNLIDHLNCNELHDWKNTLGNDSGQQTDLNLILSNAVDKAINNKFC